MLTYLLIVFLIGLIRGLTLEKFLLAVLALLKPAFVFGLRQYIEHNEAANRLDKLSFWYCVGINSITFLYFLFAFYGFVR
ncbi:S-4TM family putative pore-forming effector [Nostoc sp.]|uniref:S-4TM family putative pore-forming effector n=1 Tax=Nostoc sp. TaxID=1180 RepID=UPI003FA5D902